MGNADSSSKQTVLGLCISETNRPLCNYLYCFQSTRETVLAVAAAYTVPCRPAEIFMAQKARGSYWKSINSVFTRRSIVTL